MQETAIIQCQQLIPGDLSFDYQGEALDFEIRHGEMVSIIGHKHAEKSHWLKAICGLEDPRSGNVYLQGKDTLNLSARDWASTRIKTAYLHADTALLSAANGLMNVLAPALYHQLDKKPNKQLLVEQALEILEEIDAGLNLDELPAYISKEHQFKIATARALLLQPDILVLDTPFTHFDIDTRAHFQKFLTNRVAKGLSLLLLTDDIPYALNYSDRIIFAEKDKLHYFNSKQEILNSNNPVINQYIKLNA